MKTSWYMFLHIKDTVKGMRVILYAKVEIPMQFDGGRFTSAGSNVVSNLLKTRYIKHLKD